MKKYLMIASIALLPHSSPIYATNAVDELLNQYRSQGVEAFSAKAGQILWHQKFTKKDNIRQCTTCHTDNLRNSGKHVRTGKFIQPLAPSVNPKRLMKVKHIRKWLKRNCKWTFNRECTIQEKGDILLYIQSQ